MLHTPPCVVCGQEQSRFYIHLKAAGASVHPLCKRAAAGRQAVGRSRRPEIQLAEHPDRALPERSDSNRAEMPCSCRRASAGLRSELRETRENYSNARTDKLRLQDSRSQPILPDRTSSTQRGLPGWTATRKSRAERRRCRPVSIALNSKWSGPTSGGRPITSPNRAVGE